MSETLRDRRTRYARAILQSRSGSVALVGETSDLDGQRVLVLGSYPAETLAALIHTECRKAEARRPDACTETGSADLVLVPHPTLVTISRIVEQAARSLDDHGRIAVAVPLNERDFIGLAVKTLIQAGFETPVLQVEGGETRIHACRGKVARRA